MHDTQHISFLNTPETRAFFEAQQFLLLDAEDILFRAYDLLFSYRPALHERLPKDRYKHPNFVALLSSDAELIEVGMKSAQKLLIALAPRSERELVANLSLIRRCTLQALNDILFNELNPVLSQAYLKILEQRMLDIRATFGVRNLGNDPDSIVNNSAS